MTIAQEDPLPDFFLHLKKRASPEVKQNHIIIWD
jgi:hypothetical protein